jgi:hypothetical protein
MTTILRQTSNDSLFFSVFLDNKTKALEPLNDLENIIDKYIISEKEWNKCKNNLLFAQENFYVISSAFDSSTNSIE